MFAPSRAVLASLLRVSAVPRCPRAATRLPRFSSSSSSSSSSAAAAPSSSSSAPKEEKLKQNPFFDKYQHKIKTALELAQSQPPPAAAANANTTTPSATPTPSPSTNALAPRPKPKPLPRASHPVQPPQEKGLASVMKVELLAEATAEEIGRIWREHHATQDCLSAVIPATSFYALNKRAKECPRFVYALPRTGGYEFFFAEFTTNTCLITSLLEYKTHQSNARALLSLVHYPELLETKGIALLRGEVDTDRMNMTDAQFLANQVQIFYAGSDDSFALVRQFNLAPQTFDHNAILRKLESISA